MCVCWFTCILQDDARRIQRQTCNIFCINVYKSYVYYFHTQFVLELFIFFFYWFQFLLGLDLHLCPKFFSSVVNITFLSSYIFFCGIMSVLFCSCFLLMVLCVRLATRKIRTMWSEIFRNCPHRLCGPPSLLHNWFRVSFPGVKLPTPIYRRG